MERKVKTLIPIKSKNESLLTSLLLLLGSLLCVGAIGLLASSLLVKASSINQEGIANKSEAIYSMEFAKTGDLENPLNYMYLSGNTFYVSGAGIFVDGNEVITDKNINILGGTGNTVNAENVTLLGGNNNIVNSGNNDVSVLGGRENVAENIMNKVPSVLVGGSKNAINKATSLNGGNLIIGGNNNTVSGSQYVFILGGSGNVKYGRNSIVGGIGVVDKFAGNARNQFIFSDGSITPLFGSESTNTFFFIVKNGVGLGMPSLTSGLTSKGAVKFGDVTTCNNSSIGVMGVWSGCIVGCTKESSDVGKWELIDHGSGCREKCEGDGSRCIVSDHFDLEDDIERYPSECVGNVDTTNAIQCASGLVSAYKNVSYEIKLIGSSVSCPSANSDNKCVFKCKASHPYVAPDEKSCIQQEPKTCKETMIKPSPIQGDGVCMGPNSYIGESNIYWSFKDNCNDLNSCEWSCREGYSRAINTCVESPSSNPNPDPDPNPDPGPMGP